MVHSTDGMLAVSADISGHQRNSRTTPSSPHRSPRYSSYTVVTRRKTRSRSRSRSRGRPLYPDEVVKVVKSKTVIRKSPSRSSSLPRGRSRTRLQVAKVVEMERSSSALPPPIYMSRVRSLSPHFRVRHESNPPYVRTVHYSPLESKSPSQPNSHGRLEVKGAPFKRLIAALDGEYA